MQQTTTYHVDVTDIAIAKNDPEQVHRCRRCPLMASLQAVLPPGLYCASGGTRVTICRSMTEDMVGNGILPVSAQEQMFRLDCGKSVEPFSFDIVISWVHGFDPDAL